MICPGCGLSLPSADEQLDERYSASAACRQVYGELTAYTLSLPDVEFPHQLAVDTYAAQHASAKSKPIGLTFALVGLYLVCERNYTGKQVQKAHTLLAATRQPWPSWTPPTTRAALTVLDVLNAPEHERKQMLRQWERAVWQTWAPEQARVAKLVHQHLTILDQRKA